MAFQGLAPSCSHQKRWAGYPFPGQRALEEGAVKGGWPTLSPKARVGDRAVRENPSKPGWEPRHLQEALPDHLCRTEDLKQRVQDSCRPQLESLLCH